MGRVLIGVSLTAKELKLVRARVEQGGYKSESDVIRDSLRQTLRDPDASTPVIGRHSKSTRLAAAYRAMSAEDRKTANEWSKLSDPWPHG